MSDADGAVGVVGSITDWGRFHGLYVVQVVLPLPEVADVRFPAASYP